MVKRYAEGREYIDYTGGRTFIQFETSSKKKVMYHIIFHIMFIYIWTRVIAGWIDMNLFSEDISEAAVGWIIITIITLAPILYWGLSYRNYKQLQKGISS